MNNPLFDLNVYEIYTSEVNQEVVYNEEQHQILRHIRYGILFYFKKFLQPFLIKQDNPEKFEELFNAILKSNQIDGFINPKGFFCAGDKLFSIHQLLDKPHISKSYKLDGKFYAEFFVLRLNQLDIHQIKDFLSYHYQDFDGDYINFLSIVIDNEGKVFWSEEQINIVKLWLQKPTKPQRQPTIFDEIFNLGKDVRRIRNNFIKSLDYFFNKQVLRQLIAVGKEDTEKKIQQCKDILIELERRCSIFEKNIDLETHNLKKAKLQSLKDENCKNYEYYNLLLENKGYLLEIVKRCEYDEVSENHLLEAFRKIIEEIKVSLNSKEITFKINYGIILWIEIGYAYQTQDADFLIFLAENIQNPMLMVKDRNIFIESHTKYLTNELDGKNDNTNFDKIQAELRPLYEQVQSNDFDLLFAASIRQTEPKELKVFLNFHYNQYEGDFNEFLKICLMTYEQYINPVNIKVINQWLSSEKPNKLTALTPPEGFRLIPIGTKTQEDIKHFFSFLCSETNGDDKPFMSEEDVKEMLQFGFGIYEKPIKHYKVSVHSPKGIIKYCFQQLYLEIDSRVVKNDILVFLTQNFNIFKGDQDNLTNFKRQMTNHRPKTMVFEIDKYLS
jgi:hypothetical protein